MYAEEKLQTQTCNQRHTEIGVDRDGEEETLVTSLPLEGLLEGWGIEFYRNKEFYL